MNAPANLAAAVLLALSSACACASPGTLSEAVAAALAESRGSRSCLVWDGPDFELADASGFAARAAVRGRPERAASNALALMDRMFASVAPELSGRFSADLPRSGPARFSVDESQGFDEPRTVCSRPRVSSGSGEPGRGRVRSADLQVAEPADDLGWSDGSWR